MINIKSNSKNYILSNDIKPVEPRVYFNIYKNILKECNLKYNFHALRHTFATNAINSGCDPKALSEILGHSNVKITLDRYVHPDFNNKLQLVNQLTPLYESTL